MLSEYKVENRNVHKFMMEPILSNMYVIIIGNQALVIDPCVKKEAADLLQKTGVKKITVILTHEHYDHISGVNWLREQFPCYVIASEETKAMTPDPEKNMAAFFMALCVNKEEAVIRQAQEIVEPEYSCQVDFGVKEAYQFEMEALSIQVIKTPGHSIGSICILINEKYVFTGDSLVGGNTVITKLPGGSKRAYEKQTRPFLESLRKDTVVFPGHGAEGFMETFQIG